MSDRGQVEAVSKQILDEIGDVTLLFNNAGVRVVRPFMQHTTQQIEKTINVNVLGQIWLIRAFLPRMLAMDRGSIVSMSALAGFVGYPNMLPFSASKFAVRGLMEGLYLELRYMHV